MRPFLWLLILLGLPILGVSESLDNVTHRPNQGANPPANDDCSTATELTVNVVNRVCAVSSMDGSTEFATPATTSECQAPITGPAVFYTFTAAYTEHIVLVAPRSSVDGSPLDDEALAFEIFEGTDCQTTDVIFCASDIGRFANTNRITSLTPGQTYTIMVVQQQAVAINFRLCVVSDEPGNSTGRPIPLTVQPNSTCTGETYRTGGKGDVTPAPSCDAEATVDMYFFFVATETAHSVQIRGAQNQQTLGSARLAIRLLEADGTELACRTGLGEAVFNTAGLTVGATYLVEYNQRTFTEVFFSICIGLVPPPPENDDCGGALALDVSSSTGYVPVIYNDNNATQSIPACLTGDSADDDVWFAFTAEATGTLLTLEDINFTAGTNFERELTVELFSGTCSTLTSLACETRTFTHTWLYYDFSNLTDAGQDYFVRVYTPNEEDRLRYAIGVTPPQGNDTCAGARQIAIGGSTSVLTQRSQYETDGQCGTAEVRDQWFFFDATGNSHDISIDQVTTFNNFLEAAPTVEVVTGLCTDPALVACVTPAATGSSARGLAFTTVSGLTPGQRYYLRAYSANSSDASFSITVSEGVLPAELLTFSGTADGKSNTLYWTTARSENVRFFRAERSADGVNDWHQVARPQDAINGAREQGYRVVDAVPLPTAYYRLRTVDADGSSALSETIYLTHEGASPLSVFPNPAHDRAVVNAPNATEVSLYDLSGRQLQQLQRTVSGRYDLLLGDYPAGVYLLRSTTPTGTRKVIRLVHR